MSRIKNNRTNKEILEKMIQSKQKNFYELWNIRFFQGFFIILKHDRII